MFKILLERESRTLRKNEQFEVEVKSITEAREVKANYMGHWGSSDIQNADTFKVTDLDTNIEYYMSYNGRLWNGKYWQEDCEEVFLD